jgi:hypothetical protein
VLCNPTPNWLRRFGFIVIASLAVSISCGATLRKTVASGNWSDARIWEGGSLPADGDDAIVTIGSDVLLDVRTPNLATLTVEGTLHGGSQEIRISTNFSGKGTWLPDASRVILTGTTTETLTAASIGLYYDLVLSDTDHASATRVIDRSIVVEHDVRAVFGSNGENLSGTGDLTVGGNFLYRGGSLASWSGALRFVSVDTAVSRDTSFVSIQLAKPDISEHFALPHIIIAKRDSAVVRLGHSRFIADTVVIANSADTIVTVESGAFDMQSGWISLADPLAGPKPIIALRSRGRVRIAAPLPVYILANEDPTFDSLHTPLFVLDSGSTFEYYSYASDIIDASYLMNNIVGRAYQNLLLGKNVIASAWANPVTIRGTFHIEFGATFTPRYIKVNAAGNPEQLITLFGDVRNDAPGPSGADGFDGGIVSRGTDRWTFANSGLSGKKDTIHWSGPSQLGTVVVAPNVVLDVRHLSDTAFDSLDILNTLIEQGGPCGGHVLGTVYSETPVIFDASHTLDSVHGFGIVLRAGTDPSPGAVHVSRTSGYLPPGADPASHPILRYYATYAEQGAQNIPSTIQAAFHCDELNGVSPEDLSLWRSRDKRGAWFFLGKPDYDASTQTMRWQTSELFPPGTKRPYYWMFAQGYRDTPTPVELLNFRPTAELDGVHLNWQTASEHDLLGFEIERRSGSSTVKIASWETDSSLRSRFESGFAYSIVDPTPDPGALEYRLYERNIDGVLTLLASRTLTWEPTPPSMWYSSGKLNMPAGPNACLLRVFDESGREVRHLRFESVTSVPLDLTPGFYAIELIRNGIERAALLVP